MKTDLGAGAGGEKEGKEKTNTSLNFPLASSHTLEIETIT